MLQQLLLRQAAHFNCPESISKVLSVPYRKQAKVKGLQETNKRKGSAKPSPQFSGFILVCAGGTTHEVLCAAGRSSVLFGKPHWGISQNFLKFAQQMKPLWRCKGSQSQYKAPLQENFGNFPMYLWEELQGTSKGPHISCLFLWFYDKIKSASAVEGHQEYLPHRR